MKQKIIMIVAVVLVVVGAAWYYNGTKTQEGELADSPEASENGEAPSQNPASPSAVPAPSQTTPPSPSAGKGRVLFAVTDAAANYDSIKSVTLTITGLQMHHTTRGWITVPTGAKTYSLLDLKKASALELLADTNLEKGDYTQIRLTIGKVVVTTYTGGSAEAKLPSGDLRIITRFSVNDEGVNTVVFDVLLDKSLHTTVGGTYIFAPVVNTAIRNSAIVNYAANNRVNIAAGTSALNVMVGMTESGETKANFSLDQMAKLEIVGTAIKVIPQNESETGLTISATQAIDLALKTGRFTTALSVKLVTGGGGAKVWRVVGFQAGAIVTVDVNAMTGAIADR